MVKKFPYYIVRFKLARFVAKNPKIIGFPYYIVRFKHPLGTSITAFSMGFHTT